jgi:hypothetical protein
MARKLVNVVESLGNVERSKKHEDHGTMIGKLVAPNASWRSLESLRRGLV